MYCPKCESAVDEFENCCSKCKSPINVMEIIRMDEETFEFLEKLGALDDRTPSYIVRKMIDSFKHMSDEEIIITLRKNK